MHGEGLTRRSAACLVGSTLIGSGVAGGGSPARRIAYGPGGLQYGELRVPPGDGPHPVLIVLHGGFWQSAYRLDLMRGFPAALTASLRVATWSVEYRCVGDAGGGFPGTFLDVAGAADHLRSLATDHRLDLTRAVSLGHSAGGHLALWLAGRRRIPAASPLHRADPLPLAGVVSLAGVTDLARGDELRLGHGAVRALMGGGPAEVPERYAAGSPAALLPTGVPQVLLHGDRDLLVPKELSRDYQELATRKGDEARLVPLRGAGHFEAIDPAAPEFRDVEDAVRRLVYQPSRRGASGA